MTEPSTQSARSPFAGALAWSFTSNIVQRGTTLLVTLVLARLLGPGLFGIIALANVYVYFLQLLLQHGMMPALIHQQPLRQDHLHTGFWMVMAGAGGLSLLSIAGSPLWAAANDTTTLRDVVIAMTLLLPLKASVLVHEAILRREMNFKTIALRTTVSVLVGAAVGLGMALAGAGVWALVGQQLSTAVVEVVVLYAAVSWRPQRRFHRACMDDLLGYSVRASFASMGNFVNQRSDAVIIGIFFGPVAVGVYRLAGRLIDAIIEVSGLALQAVSLPELARLQSEPEVLGARLLEILRAASYLTVPLFAGLALGSDHLTVLLGEEWADAADVIKVLALLNALVLLMIFVSPVLQAIGRTGSLAVLSWASGAASVAGFVAAGALFRDADPSTQVIAMGWSRASGTLLFGWVLARSRRYVAVGGGQLLGAMLPSVALSAVGLAVGWTATRIIDAPLVAALVGPAVVVAVAWGAVPLVDARARRVLRRALRRRPAGAATDPVAPTAEVGQDPPPAQPDRSGSARRDDH